MKKIAIRKSDLIVFTLSFIVGAGLWFVDQNPGSSAAIGIASLEPVVVPVFMAGRTASPNPQSRPNPEASPVITSQISPDGKYSVSIKKPATANPTGYSIHMTALADDSLTHLYTASDSAVTDVSIPFNTWSPDDKYVFFKIVKDGQTDYMSLPVTGKSGITPTYIHNTFNDKHPDLRIADVTGWAAPGLLIILTTNADGEEGPSFWFEVASQHLIQLSTRF